MADSRGGQVAAWPGRVGSHLSGLLAVVGKDGLGYVEIRIICIRIR
jgi:hypothetical protein